MQPQVVEEKVKAGIIPYKARIRRPSRTPNGLLDGCRDVVAELGPSHSIIGSYTRIRIVVENCIFANLLVDNHMISKTMIDSGLGLR